MGCDIHLHIEIKTNGAWHHYAALMIERSYALFAKMAGVRTDTPSEAISAPRGIPEDVTEITKYDFTKWEADAHSASWFGIPDIMALEDWLKTESGGMAGKSLEYSILRTYLFGNHFSTNVRWPEEKIDFVEDVRFVFWFDN